jgi:hypothetical protein
MFRSPPVISDESPEPLLSLARHAPRRSLSRQNMATALRRLLAPAEHSPLVVAKPPSAERSGSTCSAPRLETFGSGSQNPTKGFKARRVACQPI